MSSLPAPRGHGPGEEPGADSRRLLIAMVVMFGLMSMMQMFTPPAPPRAPALPPSASTDGGPRPPADPGAAAAHPAAVTAAESPDLPEQVVTLQGQLLTLSISSHGGRVVDAKLTGFKPHDGRGGASTSVNVGGARGMGGGNLRLSLDGVAADASYRVVEQTPSALTLEREGAGLRVRRRFQIDVTGYGVRHDVTVENLAAFPRTVHPVVEMTADLPEDEKDKGGLMRMGAPSDQTQILCDGEADMTRQPAFGLTSPVQQGGSIRWAGLDSQYFLAAVLPRHAPGTGCQGWLAEDIAHLRLNLPDLNLPASGAATMDLFSYFGPKQEQWLSKADPLLGSSVDYGWFGALVRLLLMLLVWFHSLVPNYAAAIFLLTLSVKLVTLPLTQRSYISMQRMKDLQPRIKAMQEKYAHDKNMQAQKQMELFREENVNPLGGCLPMLIQMPVWIALYRTLYTAVELYHQPFITGWIDDLTAKDPYYITPVALGVVMLIQSALTPQPQDNPQMKYMQYGMPVFFTFLMVTLPSGLTLYMFFNAVLTIAQQLYIKRRFGKPAVAAA